MKILIDPGHGRNTAGKRSPDGRFLEYKFNRQVSNLIVADLLDKGLDARLIVPEETDIPLLERCNRINAIAYTQGIDSTILVSIHANAFGDGHEWTKPSGWSVYTSKGRTKSDNLATCLAEAAKKYLAQCQTSVDKFYM